jgi:hypothetical protein
MVYSHKKLDWVSLFFILMARNRNLSILNLRISLVFYLVDEYSTRYMESIQEMITFNTNLR